ncbi:MAG: sulfate adenylyltransferase [Acidovorax sp. SCN 68-22]|jgi:sulfate adenylyltransferase subunit 1|nr:MAG: sulfate adenylyltransferase [Acidovorax sp. SCN 68-22]
MNATQKIAETSYAASAEGQKDHKSGTPTNHDAALRFITCGSVDDGKSTLIGRLLVDTKAVLQDHLAGVQRRGETDLALLTDGLSAEREQGITIDVAYRYFATEARKFIIGDAPGHEQYTRNMVTAASSADAAVVLVDATKLDWKQPLPTLLPQTRRHSLLVHLLRVPSLVFAVNKLDAVDDPALAFAHISAALAAFAREAGIAVRATVPVSALKGWNVVDGRAGWCDYIGPSLLHILEQLPNTAPDTGLPFALPVQWVEKPTAPSQGRRVFWGRIAAGVAEPGDEVQVFPSGQRARVAEVLNRTRQPGGVPAGQSAGLVLDREIDISRGDWLLAAAPEAGSDDFDAPPSPWPAQTQLSCTVAWLDEQPLVAGRVYQLLHGHRWVKARVRSIVHGLDIHTLAEQPATELAPNAIGHVELQLQSPVPAAPYARARQLGAMILVDSASNRTAGAVLLR